MTLGKVKVGKVGRLGHQKPLLLHEIVLNPYNFMLSLSLWREIGQPTINVTHFLVT